MRALKCATRSGSEIMLPHAAVDGFRSRVLGGVLGCGDDGYDRARVVFNAMIDRLPALIVQLGSAVVLTYPVMWLDQLFARRTHVWWDLPNVWAGPLLWLIGCGVAMVLWRRGLQRLAFGVGVGTLLIGLVIFAGSM